MLRRPPRATRADTLCPYTTLVRSILHIRVAIEVFLDLAREQVLAAADHHVLHPADDIAIAFLVEHGEVAGMHPTGGIDRIRRLLRLIPVPAHHRIATGAEFALLARPRSEERRVGKGCVSTCRSRGSPDH